MGTLTHPHVAEVWPARRSSCPTNIYLLSFLVFAVLGKGRESSGGLLQCLEGKTTTRTSPVPLRCQDPRRGRWHRAGAECWGSSDVAKALEGGTARIAFLFFFFLLDLFQMCPWRSARWLIRGWSPKSCARPPGAAALCVSGLSLPERFNNKCFPASGVFGAFAKSPVEELEPSPTEQSSEGPCWTPKSWQGAAGAVRFCAPLVPGGCGHPACCVEGGRMWSSLFWKLFVPFSLFSVS